MSQLLSREQTLRKVAEKNPISEEKLNGIFQALKAKKTTLSKAVAESGWMEEENWVAELSRMMDLPMLPLASLKISPDVMRLISRNKAFEWNVLGISKMGNVLTLAVGDPFDWLVLDEVRERTSCSLQLILASTQAIRLAIETNYNESQELESILDLMDDADLEVLPDKPEGGDDNSAQSVSDAPVVQLVKLVLEDAIKMRASDIHFEPYEDHFRVRLRVDGRLSETIRHSRKSYGALCARIKILAQLDVTQRRIPQDGRFRSTVSGQTIDFRVSVLPIYHGEKIVMRVLDKSGVRKGLHDLGFAERPTRIFEEAIQKPYGMILVTGPTGSGKSTTLYSILSELNTPQRNIMTVEDPVEYQVEGITQTQVYSDIGLTFANGLRCLLRQSPDVILVGEIRDGETADIAVKAALTGHLVFSTLHTNSACGSVTRLMDMGLEPFLIASSLICVAAQRLLRRICPDCKVQIDFDGSLLKPFGIEWQGKIWHGKGCARCHQTGYWGRLGAIEVLPLTPAIREMVLDRKSSDVIEKKAIEEGMQTLFQNALELCKQGKTSIEEVLRLTSPGE